MNTLVYFYELSRREYFASIIETEGYRKFYCTKTLYVKHKNGLFFSVFIIDPELYRNIEYNFLPRG